jgi:hypothetical protein
MKQLFFIIVFIVLLGAASRFPLPAQELSGELVLRSYLYTYPGKVKEVTRIDGDWAIQTEKETFFWAGGRLLPAKLRENQEKFRPHIFAVYPRDVPRPELYTQEQIENLRIQGSAEARLDREDHHNGFQAVLYGGLTRAEIERDLVRTVFLGRPLVVHRDIAEALGRIDAAIVKAGKDDPETTAFIAGIGSVGGYNWREIRGTHRMSYHSWGLAVDIQPKILENKVIYWLWEQAYNDRWMLVPLERRWYPPEAVIRAFENEGFTWGGKWPLYDNMHFEFRPELHEINRLLAAGTGSARITGSEKVLDLHHILPGPLKN